MERTESRVKVGADIISPCRGHAIVRPFFFFFRSSDGNSVEPAVEQRVISICRTNELVAKRGSLPARLARITLRRRFWLGSKTIFIPATSCLYFCYTVDRRRTRFSDRFSAHFPRALETGGKFTAIAAARVIVSLPAG